MISGTIRWPDSLVVCEARRLMLQRDRMLILLLPLLIGRRCLRLWKPSYVRLRLN